jgi:hypothetical protein
MRSVRGSNTELARLVGTRTVGNGVVTHTYEPVRDAISPPGSLAASGHGLDLD